MTQLRVHSSVVENIMQQSVIAHHGVAHGKKSLKFIIIVDVVPDKASDHF